MHQHKASLSGALLWRGGRDGLSVHAGRHYREGQTGMEGLRQDTADVTFLQNIYSACFFVCFVVQVR